MRIVNNCKLFGIFKESLFSRQIRSDFIRIYNIINGSPLKIGGVQLGCFSACQAFIYFFFRIILG